MASCSLSAALEISAGGDVNISVSLHMAFLAVSEIAVHIGRFRNVDLFEQGLYHLRCKLFQETGEQNIDAVPHHFGAEESPGTGQNLPSAKDSPALAASVVEQGTAFRTKSVLIRYCEEEVEINDICQFRIEQPAESKQPWILELRLMFAKYHGEALLASGPALRISDSAFKSESVQRLRLHNTVQGGHSYSPVVFDEFHFCQVGLIVHRSLVDFRLRLPPSGLGDPTTRLSALSLEESLLKLARLMEAKTDDQQDMDGPALLASAVDRIQREYVGRLAAAHAQILDFLAVIRLQKERGGVDKALVYPGPSGTLDGNARLSDRLVELNAMSACRLLMEDLGFMSGQVLDVWQMMLKVMPRNLEEVTAKLRHVWEKLVVERWSERIFRDVSPPIDVAVPSDSAIWATHGKLAATLRESRYLQDLPPMPIEDFSVQLERSTQPVLFEQRFKKDATLPSVNGYSRGRLPAVDVQPLPYQGLHVFVLVHGFQGNSFDMRLIRNNISLLYPRALYLCSSANEKDTEGDIAQMGVRLADEVKLYVREWCPGKPEPSLGRLSFIAHSVGGLIVRSALPHLEAFKDQMYTFLSLSSPHLGYMYTENSLFKTGLWIAKKVRKSTCLEQLSMTDSLDVNETFLSQLARAGGLEHFQSVVLASSFQDQYAPFESARIEISSIAMADPKFGQHYSEMARSILDPLDAERLIRFNVNFHIPETNLDTVIGRAAHIHFIECQHLMQMLVHGYGFLFE